MKRAAQHFQEQAALDALVVIIIIIIIIRIHDRMCAQLHFNICKETAVQLDKKHWYEHVLKSVETSQGGKVYILWNQ